MLDAYTNQESRFDKSFSTGATCCSVTCVPCGRTYFVTSPGHGDYDKGELDALRKRAKTDAKCIEVPDFSNVDFADIDGRRIVIGCECKAAERYMEWIEHYAKELTHYLKLYWQSKKSEAESMLLASEQNLVAVEACHADAP